MEGDENMTRRKKWRRQRQENQTDCERNAEKVNENDHDAMRKPNCAVVNELDDKIEQEGGGESEEEEQRKWQLQQRQHRDWES